MLINEEFKNMVSEKYELMKKEKVHQAILDKEKLGNIMVFINEKPKSFLWQFEFSEDVVYVGSNDL